MLSAVVMLEVTQLSSLLQNLAEDTGAIREGDDVTVVVDFIKRELLGVIRGFRGVLK